MKKQALENVVFAEIKENFISAFEAFEIIKISTDSTYQGVLAFLKRRHFFYDNSLYQINATLSINKAEDDSCLDIFYKHVLDVDLQNDFEAYAKSKELSILALDTYFYKKEDIFKFCLTNEINVKESNYKELCYRARLLDSTKENEHLRLLVEKNSTTSLSSVIQQTEPNIESLNAEIERLKQQLQEKDAENETFKNKISELESLLADALSKNTPSINDEPQLQRKPLGKSRAKEHAQIAAKTLANFLWNQDKDNKIKIKEMAITVHAELNQTEHRDQLPDQSVSLKGWIEDIAPKYAREAGRPKEM